MKTRDFLFYTLILFSFSTCEDETVNLDVIDELTVQAFLHGGQTLDSVVFGKVIPLDSLTAQPAPSDLVPTIVDEDGIVYELYYTGEDGIYKNEDLFIAEDKSYSLSVDYQGKRIQADTYVPFAPTGVSLSESSVERTQILDFTDLQNQEIPDPLEVTWDGEDGAYFFVHVRNIEEEPEPVNTLFEGGGGPARPDFLTEPSTSTVYTIDMFRDITHFGLYEVIIYRVNPEYVALYEDNTSGTGNLNEIRTNVENGYGIFTGVNSSSAFFEVLKK